MLALTISRVGALIITIESVIDTEVTSGKTTIDDFH